MAGKPTLKMTQIQSSRQDLATGNTRKKFIRLLIALADGQLHYKRLGTDRYIVTQNGIKCILAQGEEADIQIVSKFDISKLFNYTITTSTDKYPYRGDEFYRSSALYAKSGMIHTDRRLTIVPTMKMTQGMGIFMSYGCEAITSLANAFSYYIMYKTGKNVYHTVKEFRPDAWHQYVLLWRSLE